MTFAALLAVSLGAQITAGGALALWLSAEGKTAVYRIAAASIWIAFALLSVTAALAAGLSLE